MSISYADAGDYAQASEYPFQVKFSGLTFPVYDAVPV